MARHCTLAPSPPLKNNPKTRTRTVLLAKPQMANWGQFLWKHSCVANRTCLCLIQKHIFHFFKKENVTVDESYLRIGALSEIYQVHFEPVPEVCLFVSPTPTVPPALLPVAGHSRSRHTARALVSTLTWPQSRERLSLNTWHLWWSHSV